MKTFSTRTTTALSLAAATGLILCGLSQPAQAGDPGVACESSKLKAQGKYSACLKKADATAVKKGVAADYTKCIEKITSAYTKAETKAAGACPRQGDVADVIQILDAARADTSTGTAGGTYVFCGDSVIDGNESCDGAALDDETCEGLGYASGLLACTAGCGFDVSGCVSNPPDTCGNSLIDGNESCDGSALGGETCEGLGFASGSLTCTAGCGFDVSGCVPVAADTCGDGVIDAGEECDQGAIPELQSCDLRTGGAEPYGELVCGANCTLDTSGCTSERWQEHGDGTVTDRSTGLMWELKDTLGGIHDVGNVYTWSGASYNVTNEMDGTAFTDFINVLNGNTSNDGVTFFTGGFAGYTDWVMPRIDQLQTIVDTSAPGCVFVSPCTTIPGATARSFDYWTSSTYYFNEPSAWAESFDTLTRNPSITSKNIGRCVRAVRGG